MDTLFRILYLHLRSIWLRTRALFFSIRFHRLRTSSSKNAPTTHRPPPPMPNSATASIIASRATASSSSSSSSTARTKAWACTRTRELKARMKERLVAKKNKQAMYARMAVGTPAAGTAGGINEHCAEQGNEDDEEAPVEERDALETLFRPPSTSIGPSRRPRSLFSPAPSPLSLSRASTPGLSPALRSELTLAFELGYPSPLPSPTVTCASSDSSAPATPATPMGFPGPSIGTADHYRHVDAPASTPIAVRPRPHPRPRAQFRTLSASITAFSPLSLSFPLSLSLPLVPRRASTPSAAMRRYMDEDDGEDEDDDDGRVGGAWRARGCAGGAEDPFGTHGSAYYAPGARTALGRGDAYDLSAWAWARDVSPHRGAKKRKRHQHVQAEQQQQQQQQYGVRAPHPATTTSAAAPSASASGETTGSGSVYRAPVHAASAPQLSCVRRADKELEYLRALADATARARVVQPPVPASVGHRRGIRPLLLPQKFGLLGSSGPQRETGKVDSFTPGRRGRDASGWELDLERGVCNAET